ncbi:hypothetical protein [Aminobacter sp. Piv2-1]
MSNNQTGQAKVAASGNKEALKGWIVILVLVAVVLTSAYLYTH